MCLKLVGEDSDLPICHLCFEDDEIEYMLELVG